MLLGDFNAHHSAWGYQKCQKKGTKLWETAQDLGFTLLVDPERPTRIGNSVSQNTSPDLTFTRNIDNAIWENTELNVGSDHYILSITVPSRGYKRNKVKIKHTKWDAFRYVRNRREPATITNLEEWISTLLKDAANSTTEVDQEEDGPAPDAKLVHLWSAQQSLQKRWLAQKHNRGLRRRIAQLERDIEKYSRQLSQEHWHQLCDRLNGQLGCKNTWFLLKHLLDPSQTKTASQKNLQRIIHSFPGDNDALFEALKNRYFNTSTDIPLPVAYTGKENRELDSEIMESEVRAVLNNIKTTAAAGEDRITNKMLRNLDDRSVTEITNLFNIHWKEGTIPTSWKHANVIFIPKPGKKLELENLRPISLTSCLGKVMEHVILNRLNEYTESNGLLPHTLIGFRSNLSTQDIMWQIQQDILHPGPIRATRTILGWT